MRIVHVAPNAPYNDNWGYQENLLPRYQKKLGHTVTILIPNLCHGKNGIEKTECRCYVLEDGVQVIRLEHKDFGIPAISNTASWLPVYPLLKELQPDLIFFHGLISLSIFDAIKYKKHHPECALVQDNHLDYIIGKPSATFKDRVFRSYYRLINRLSVPYVDRIYGVTPLRQKYAEDYFRIPPEKMDLLIMGADDEQIDFANREVIRKQIRGANGIQESDFLIVSGGKLDSKKKILTLMRACANNPDVKLLIFGKVDAEIREEFERVLSKADNIVFTGWLSSEMVYDYFLAADLAFFPGQHSVLWEQACACKIPCVFESREGIEHVNNGGNADFLCPVNETMIAAKIRELYWTPKYQAMQQAARSARTDVFLHSYIAVKSIECAKRR